jgi:hypothetical protein
MVQCVGWSILKWSLTIVEVALSSLFYAPPFEKVAFTLPTAWEQVWEGHPPPPPREAVPCPNAPSFGGRRSHPEQGHRSIYPGRQHPAFGRWPPPWHLSPGFDTGALCAARVRGAERSGGIRGIRSCANSSARTAGTVAGALGGQQERPFWCSSGGTVRPVGCRPRLRKAFHGVVGTIQ